MTFEMVQRFGTDGTENAARVLHLASDHLSRIGRENAEKITAQQEALTNVIQNFIGTGLAGQGFMVLGLLAQWQAYGLDATQRMALTLDTLRQRGNIFNEHEESGMPPVLDFAHERIVDGRTMPRPVNYHLLKITPPAGVQVDPAKRPFMIVDPRAGHGAGIGGFKPESQVGEAFEDGHAVYFVVFDPLPMPGQTLADVREAEKAFLAEITRRHPQAPKPVVIGNCQGGWASMILAASSPDQTGPLSINGAPMSYWAGESGKNPMRYTGGIVGGVVPALLMADLGNGVFDGSLLVQNFENLNPANTYWKKLYNLYANVDREADRFLEFERWWGGFFMMNENEIRWIVDNLFVGNRLAHGIAELGKDRIDLKNITAPIVVFASQGDNITPPPQALNWIPDLYRDVNEIKARGQRIVYMVHDSIGHLGIFVSAKIAGREHDAITDTMRAIEALPPGLYEMVLEPAADRMHIKFAPRTVDDILSLDDGRYDEEMFAAVARLSEFGAESYELTLRPLVRAMVTPDSAKAFFKSRQLRVDRAAFSDRNPVMQTVKSAADQARAERQPVATDNPFLAIEKLVSDQIEMNLNLFRDMRDAMQEIWFHGVYGSPFMRMIGAQDIERRRKAADEDLRKLPEVREALAAMTVGGEAEGTLRMLELLSQARGYTRRSRLEKALHLFESEEPFKSMDATERAKLIHAQSLVVQFAPDEAKSSLPLLLDTHEERERALDFVMRIAGPEDTMHPEALALYREFEAMLTTGASIADVSDHRAEIQPAVGMTAMALAPAADRDETVDSTSEETPVDTAGAAPAETPAPTIGEPPASARTAGDQTAWVSEDALAFDDSSVMPTAPLALSAPQGQPDDLIIIKGIGPKILRLLHSLGIHHFWQVAGWTPAEIAWINSKIDFPGRIQREKWVQQARTLMQATNAAAE